MYDNKVPLWINISVTESTDRLATIELLTSRRLVMIDIWKGDLFHVLQIDDKKIGLSSVTNDTVLGTIPVKSYNGIREFSIDFEKIF